MPLIIPANTLSADAYEISNSGQFNDGQTQALTRTHGASGSTRTFTFSCWVKFSDRKLGSSATECCHGLFASEEETNHQFFISTDENIFRIADYQDGSYNLHLKTNRLFRDYSAWYHFCIIFDTTNGTEGDRCKLYVNGVRETSFSTETYPSVNTDLYGNGNQAHFIGRRGGSNTQYFDGYMADVNFIDGTAAAHTDFGESNDNGVWVPKKFSGSYGTNGFFLEFGNTGTGQGSGRFASDTSGQGNHYDTNNFSGQYQMTDTPTNNFCTLNPNDKGSEVNSTASGNLVATWNGANGHTIRSTMAVNDGKWYWEITGADNLASGIVHTDEPIIPTSGGLFPGGSGYGAGNSYAYILADGKTRTNNAQTTYGESVSTSETLGCALDLDNGKIYWSVDGVWQNSGNPVDGSNPAYTGIETGGKFFSPAWGYQTGGEDSVNVNFGNPKTTISSGNADDNGYGNFEYDVPTGYYALCTKNLAEFG